MEDSTSPDLLTVMSQGRSSHAKTMANGPTVGAIGHHFSQSDVRPYLMTGRAA